MKKIEKIRILSFAKFQAILMGFLGLAAGIIYSFGGLAIDILVSLEWVTSTETPGLSFGTILAFGALIGMPIIFAASGFILGIVEALLYNLYARWFGGVRVDFTQ
jgi:hypothetical protein